MLAEIQRRYAGAIALFLLAVAATNPARPASPGTWRIVCAGPLMMKVEYGEDRQAVVVLRAVKPFSSEAPSTLKYGECRWAEAELPARASQPAQSLYYCCSIFDALRLINKALGPQAFELGVHMPFRPDAPKDQLEVRIVPN